MLGLRTTALRVDCIGVVRTSKPIRHSQPVNQQAGRGQAGEESVWAGGGYGKLKKEQPKQAIRGRRGSNRCGYDRVTTPGRGGDKGGGREGKVGVP